MASSGEEEAGTGSHLEVGADIFVRWHDIGAAHGLTTDTQIARFFIQQYETNREDWKSSSSPTCSSCQSPLTFFCTFCQLPPPPPPPSLHPNSTAGRLSSISDYVEIKRETEDMCGATGRSCRTSLGTDSQQGRATTASSKGGKGRTVLGLPGSRTVSGLLGNERHKPTRVVTRRAAQNTIRAGKALHSARRPRSARCDDSPSSEGQDEADRGTYSPAAANICVNEAKTVDRDPTLQDISGSMEECFSAARTSDAHADSPVTSSALEWADDPAQCLQREKPFVCSICNKAFSLPCKLKIHRRKHSGQRPYTCKMCCASYITMFSLTRHINNKHIGFRPHSCKQCSKAFFESAALKRHMLLHSDAKPHVCSECDAAFSLKYILQKHRLIHSGQAHSETKHTEKRFLCSECGVCFGQKQSLVSHMHKHAGIKPHVCPQCGAAFTEKGTLRSHLRLHTDDRPYVCESCGERYTTNSGLTVHKRRHLGYRPYKCGGCGKGFYTQGDLKKHGRVNCTKPVSL